MKHIFGFLALLGSGVFSLCSLPVSAQQPDPGGNLPGTFLYPENNREQRKEDQDLRAGDSAFNAGDYPVAVSFYTRYLQKCREKGLREQEKEAYERLLDALLPGRFTQAAQRYLQEYETRFPAGKKDHQRIQSRIWRSEILFQQGKYPEAALLYRELHKNLPMQDPRRFRVTFSLAVTLEKQKLFQEAAELFLDLWKQNRNSARQERKLFKHTVLCLAAAGQWEKARDMLLEYPPSPEENIPYALLEAYIALKQYGPEGTMGIWKNLLRSSRKEKDQLWYIVASSYGDALAQKKELSLAQRSYRAAFHASPDNHHAQETLNRMIDVVAEAGNIQKAAELAASQLELFSHASLKAELKLRTADLLRDSGKHKEALALYESVFVNIASTYQERRKALYEYALLLGRKGQIRTAEKVIRANTGRDHAVDGEYLLAEVLVRLNMKKEFLRQYDSISLMGKNREHFVKSLMLCARAAVDQKMPREALARTARVREFLKERIQNIPDLYYIEATAYTILQEKEKALALYREYLRLGSRKDPIYPLALYHAGTLAFLAHNEDDSFKYLSRLKKEYPAHKLIPEASVWLIQIQSQRNNEVYADRETMVLAEQYPDSEYALDALFRLAQKDMAENSSGIKVKQILTKLIGKKNFPRIQARALYELARYENKNGKPEEALGHLHKLYEVFPGMEVTADAYYLHGDILRNRSDFSGAKIYYEKVLEKQKDTPLAAAALGSAGDCYYNIGSRDPQTSADTLKKAMESYAAMQKIRNCPPVFDAMGYYRTGRCQEALGQAEKAAQEYLKVLHKFPARHASMYPAETTWCVRAAERLIVLAQRNPLRSTLAQARTALHWLCDARLLARHEAVRQFEKLKSYQFNP